MRNWALWAATLWLIAGVPALVPAADARPISAEETATVAGRVKDFDAAIRANDYPAVIGFVPPRIFETIAADNKIPVDTLRDVVSRQMAAIFEGVTLESFAIETGRAQPRETPDGTPYLLVPTTTILDVKGMRVQFDTHTLAMQDGPTWYLVRLDDPDQIDVLRRAYPQFAAETFPLGASRQIPAN